MKIKSFIKYLKGRLEIFLNP